tara:strand:- start:484 stop:699 length:216 start_codon:yes stop_codon:yes gene_type:complete
MKESKLIEMKKKIDALTNVVSHLLKQVSANETLCKGTLTAFQLHIGKDEWTKLVEELKQKEKRIITEKDVE